MYITILLKATIALNKIKNEIFLRSCKNFLSFCSFYYICACIIHNKRYILYNSQQTLYMVFIYTTFYFEFSFLTKPTYNDNTPRQLTRYYIFATFTLQNGVK